jgi:hypothetical protein
MWTAWAANVHHPDDAATFSSEADRPALSPLFDFWCFWDHAHDGGARNRRIAARMARTIAPVTATSASWKVMARA